MNTEEINIFLASFNTNSYNRSQIGNSKQLITTITEYLDKLNISKENIELLLSHIAYLNKDRINIPLFLELLNKSYSFINMYSLNDVVKTVLEVHNVYYKNSSEITLEKYIHDTTEERTRNLFLNRNTNYIEKDFTSEEVSEYVCDLKLASAIKLEAKEYKEFIGYINEFSKYQKFYSPLINFQTYCKIRESLKGKSQLFWDIYFGNEYVISLSKNNIDIKNIYKENVYGESNIEFKKSSNYEQLDLFSYQEVEDRIAVENEQDIKSFQICTVYNCGPLPAFTKEKEMLNYFQDMIDNNLPIVLPKLKTNENSNYLYE